MMEQELIKYLSSFGGLGIMCAWLFTNVMKEKKEDRDMYKKAMDRFVELNTDLQATNQKQQETNKMLVNSMQNLVKDVTEVKEDVTTIRLTVEELSDKIEGVE